MSLWNEWVHLKSAQLIFELFDINNKGPSDYSNWFIQTFKMSVFKQQRVKIFEQQSCTYIKLNHNCVCRCPSTNSGSPSSAWWWLHNIRQVSLSSLTINDFYISWQYFLKWLRRPCGSYNKFTKVILELNIFWSFISCRVLYWTGILLG